MLFLFLSGGFKSLQYILWETKELYNDVEKIKAD